MEQPLLEDILSSYYFPKEVINDYDKKKFLIEKYKEDLFDEDDDFNVIESLKGQGKSGYIVSVSCVSNIEYICLYYVDSTNRFTVTVEAIVLDEIDRGMIKEIEKKLGIDMCRENLKNKYGKKI